MNVRKRLMHVGHVCRNLTAKEEIEKHRRNRQQQAATRCNERFSDPLGQVGRFGLAAVSALKLVIIPETVPSNPIMGASKRVQVMTTTIIFVSERKQSSAMEFSIAVLLNMSRS